jgi:hypothetical protein
MGTVFLALLVYLILYGILYSLSNVMPSFLGATIKGVLWISSFIFFCGWFLLLIFTWAN